MSAAAVVWFKRDLRVRDPAPLAEAMRFEQALGLLAALGGTASITSYAIALWAMTRAPVASVAALRETSVLFAAVIGTLVLKEAFGLQRALGTIVIVAGVVALRFA